MTSCVHQMVGAAATLALQHLPYQFSITVDQKAVVKTLVTLVKKGNQLKNEKAKGEIEGESAKKDKEPLVVEFSTSQSQEVLKELANKVPDASVIIEVGAVMRDYSTLLKIGQDLLDHLPNFDAVATFDVEGIPQILIRGNDRFIAKDLADVPPNKIFWFYGQKDTTGTDQKLLSSAKAVLSVNEGTTLTEFVQGVGRMRSFFGEQQVLVGVDKDSALLIKKALRVPLEHSLNLFDLYTYFCTKEGQNNGLANFYSLSKQWNALLENNFWDTSIAIGNGAQVARIFQLLREELVDSTLDDPLNAPSMSLKPIEIEKALRIQSDRFEKKRARMEEKTQNILMFAGQFKKESIEPFQTKIQNNMLYPKEMLMSQNGEATQEALATAEQTNQATAEAFSDVFGEQLASEESETTVESLQIWSTWTSRFANKVPLPHQKEVKPISMERLFSTGNLQKFFPLFKEFNLQVSENGACTFEGDTPEHSGWENGYVKPLHYLVKKDSQYILIDQDEMRGFLKSQDCELIWVVDQGVLLSKEGLLADQVRKDPNFKRIELGAKLLNGDLQFDDEQWNDFCIWVGAMDGEKKLLLDRFIKEVLFDLHPFLEVSAEYHKVNQWLRV